MTAKLFKKILRRAEIARTIILEGARACFGMSQVVIGVKVNLTCLDDDNYF
jgi:hypothetical protein